MFLIKFPLIWSNIENPHKIMQRLVSLACIQNYSRYWSYSRYWDRYWSYSRYWDRENHILCMMILERLWEPNVIWIQVSHQAVAFFSGGSQHSTRLKEIWWETLMRNIGCPSDWQCHYLGWWSLKSSENREKLWVHARHQAVAFFSGGSQQ